MKLKYKYWLDFSEMKRGARWNKFILVLWVAQWVVTLFFSFDKDLTLIENIRLYYKSGFFIFSAIFGGIILLFALTVNSLSFVNDRKIKTFRYHYKKDIINSVRLAFPEIKDYLFNQKLNQHYFIDSKLFKKKFYEYLGDDGIKCNYNNIDYEFCELNVYRVFRTVFHGIFIVAFFPDGADDNRQKISTLLNEFMKANNKKAVFSTANEYLYIAIHLKQPFLEFNTEKQILNVDNEIKFIENILLLMRGIIDN